MTSICNVRSHRGIFPAMRLFYDVVLPENRERRPRYGGQVEITRFRQTTGTNESVGPLNDKTFELLDAAVRPIHASELVSVFIRSGIRRPVEDLLRIQVMLNNANLLVGAWSGNTLVGVARGVTDFSYCCYLSDLAVDAAFQGTGIGRALIQHVRDKLGERVMIVLLSSPEAEGFYPRLGFEQIDNGWKLPRR